MFSPFHWVDGPAGAASSGGMSDLAKILIAATVGMLTGLLGSAIGEPLKHYGDSVVRRRKIRRALIFDLVNLHNEIETALAAIKIKFIIDEDLQIRLLRQLEPEAFNLYHESDKEILLSIDNWPDFKEIFSLLKDLQGLYKEESVEGLLTRIDKAICRTLTKLGIKYETIGDIEGPPPTPQADSPASSPASGGSSFEAPPALPEA